MSGSLRGVPLIFYRLVKSIPRLVKLFQVDIGTGYCHRRLAQKVSQSVAWLHRKGPMCREAEILRIVPMVFDALAALSEVVTPQRSVLVEEQLVVDVTFGKVLVQQLKHLQIKVAQAVEIHQFAIGYKLDRIVK